MQIGWKLLVIDVDGTMTDAGVYYDEHGNELKKFCTRDAAGFFAAYAAGIEIMVLTGRVCAATERRMKELKVPYLHQSVHDKREFLQQFMQQKGLCREQVAYFGDDLNDWQAMQLAGFVACPADSCAEVLQIADYISPCRGGQGAVRDMIEHLLRKTGVWNWAAKQLYGAGQ